MVSWIRMFSDGSGPNGVVGSYGRVVTVDPSIPRRALYSTAGTAVLASPGTVDTNTPTRFQYAIRDAFLPLFRAEAAFRYDSGDVAAYPGKNFTATAFLAPASAFAPNVVPTPDQIRVAAVEVFRSFNSPRSRTTAGDLTNVVMIRDLAGDINNITAYPPNLKFWLAVCPTVVDNMSSTPSIANDVPMYGANTHGRAISLWTNRTPLAPVITSPSRQVSVFPGQSIDIRFSPRDPDRITSYPGDSGVPDFEDLAGVQIQYRARPTDADPAPAWTDLPITDLTGATPGQGWYMDDIPVNASNEGAYYFWLTQKMVLRCGDVAGLTAASAALPTGDWELRVRTFDYGHGWSDSANLTVSPPGIAGQPPLGDKTRAYNPGNYPAANTSPWSESVRVFINPQVPKPLPISPSNSAAIIEGAPVTLTWQYRNTYSPPYPQATRTVQIRLVGDSAWTSLVTDEASASSTLLVSGFSMVSGNQYEWRVKVTDAGGSPSEFSDPATFWVVAVPGSGGVIPVPGDTVDGATLGCGTHRAFIYRRGGQERVAEITGIEKVEWNRTRDDISVSEITVRGWDIDCGNLLSMLEPWAYEVVLFRDNGFSVDRVWEGPITLLTYKRDSVVVQAKDVVAYLYRRIIKQPMVDSGNSTTAGDTVTNRAARIVLNALAPDDPNLLGYLQVLSQPDDAKQYRSLPAYSRTAFEEIDDMAANAGLDYTAVGRAILLWGTKHRIGTLPEFQDRDLGSPPIVSVYGMSMANRYVVSDGNGIYGEATRLDDSGQDETFGLVEMLSSTWASDAGDEAGTYTEEGVATVKASFAAAAERSIADRYPPPVVVRVPDNTRLNPDTVLSIQHLVPGVVVPLRSTGTLRTVVATQKLDSIKVVEVAGDETITITLSPFSRDDIDTGEGTEET